jgi:16S rRNA (adenine1518-N6/adenine1519-N6)-dimethyltransferase
MTDISSLPSLKALITAYGLSARKNLGQHFLLDEGITDQVAFFAGDLKGFHVAEIGPGPGGLTRSLIRAQPETLTVLEMDERCIAALAPIKQLLGARLTIIEGDALKVDLQQALPAPRKIVANLPYNAGTPMLINWLEDIYKHGAGAYASLTLMFQKEVAERITARHGNKDYGRLSVLAQWLCECRYDMELPPEAFSPPPKVSSAVITLIPRPQPLVDVKLETLEMVMAKAFGQRRKMLRSALKGLHIPADQLLEAAGIEPTLRAEQVDIHTLCRLAKTYQDLSLHPR